MTTKGYSRLMRRLALLGCLCLLAAGVAHAQDRSDRLPRIAIDEVASGPLAPELQLRAGDLPVPVMARVTANLETDAKSLDARLTHYASRKLPVWLAIAAPPAV